MSDKPATNDADSPRRLTGEERAAVEELHGRFGRRLMGVVLRKLWGNQIAEDVVQSVLLSYAVNHLGKAAGTEASDVWKALLAVALRHCDKHIKRKQRDRMVPMGTLGHPGGEEEGGFDAPDPRLAPDMEEVVFEDCVADLLVRVEQKGLHERERGVLRLLLAGRTLNEMAVETGLTVGLVRGVVARIRRVADEWAKIVEGE